MIFIGYNEPDHKICFIYFSDMDLDDTDDFPLFFKQKNCYKQRKTVKAPSLFFFFYELQYYQGSEADDKYHADKDEQIYQQRCRCDPSFAVIIIFFDHFFSSFFRSICFCIRGSRRDGFFRYTVSCRRFGHRRALISGAVRRIVTESTAV